MDNYPDKLYQVINKQLILNWKTMFSCGSTLKTVGREEIYWQLITFVRVMRELI